MVPIRRFHSDRLRRANNAFAKRVEKFNQNAPTPQQVEHLRALRNKHLERLRIAPFFKELLSRRHAFDIRANGHTYQYTLLLNGFAMDRFQRPVVVLLDSIGRKLLFYKSTGTNSTMPDQWLPFNAVKFMEFDDGQKDWWYQKYAKHPSSQAEFKALPQHIQVLSNLLGRMIPELVRDQQMKFKKDWNMDQISAINQML